ncbi:MAG TPA: cation:proton antiporter [Myxococcota bacterium]
MEPAHFVLDFLLVLLAAVVGAGLFERLRLPAVAGLLLAGACVGPGGLGLVGDPERVRVLAELGVALLLFEIGLELPIDALRGVWRRAVLSGALQVSLSVAGVSALAVALGARLETAILMGMLIALSSTALVMRVLAQRGELHAPHGQLSVGILLFQDLCVVPFLLAVPFLAGDVGGRPNALALAVAWDVLALLAFFGAARFLLPWVLEQVARLRSPDLFSLSSFLLAIGSALVAEWLGLTLAVGAFVAGLVVNASPYAHQLFAEVVPLRGVLLSIFFTAVGMLLDPAAAAQAWSKILAFVSGVLLLKTGVIVLVVALVLRQGLRIGLLTGIALAQTGEFSFVLAAAAAPSGLLDAALEQTFVGGSVLTLIATPFLVRAGPHLARALAGGMERLGLDAGAAPAVDDVSDHVVIVGFGLAGRTLARVLEASDIPYRVVDQNPALVGRARTGGQPVLFGDATRPGILERVGVARAKLVSIAMSDPAATQRCVSVVRALAPHVRIVVRTRYVQEIDEIFAQGATEVVAEEFEASIDLFSKVLRAFEIPEQIIVHFAEAMRMEGYEFLRETVALPLDPWLAEVLQEVSTEWIDVPDHLRAEHSIRELGIRARTGASILAVRRGDTTTPNPAPEFRIRAGDALLVLAPAEGPPKLRELLGALD